MYVINLKRRKDRLELFDKRIGEKYVVVPAIDGSKFGGRNTVYTVDEDKILSDVNDYDSNPRISSIILSHYNTWKSIVDSGKGGIVFEDDICFAQDWYEKWNNIVDKIDNLKVQIVYLGMGDVLPEHTSAPTEHMLRAQQKLHIVPGTLENGVIGEPRVCPYVFEWFGAFSYYISSITAKYLVSRIRREKIGCAIDVWLKNLSIPHRVTYPLLTYHEERMDSDTTGMIKLKLPAGRECSGCKTFFMMLCTSLDQLKLSLQSIIENADRPDNVYVGVYIAYQENMKEIEMWLRSCIRDDHLVVIYSNGVYEYEDNYQNIYNNLWKNKFGDTGFARAAEGGEVDFVVPWMDTMFLGKSQTVEDGKIQEIGWDTVLEQYHIFMESPRIVCYKLDSKQQNVVLQKLPGNVSHLYFDGCFLSSELLMIMGGVSIVKCVDLYLKYVTYLSGICVPLEEINYTNYRLVNSDEYVEDDIFYTNKMIKANIDRCVEDIVNNSVWWNVGLWNDYRSRAEWKESNKVLKIFEKTK